MCLQDKDNNFQKIILTATQWTKMCGPPLMADWKCSDCCVACHYVKMVWVQSNAWWQDKRSLAHLWVMPQLRWLIIRFSQWGPMYVPRAAHVGSVIKKATLGQILLETLQLCPVHFIPQMPHIQSSIIHKNDNGSIIGCSSTEPSSALFKNSLLLLTAQNVCMNVISDSNSELVSASCNYK